MFSGAFETVTGMTVTLGLDSIGIIQSPGVAGSLSAEEALRALVVGTSVRFRLTSSTTAVLELAAAGESVEVTGRAPAAAVASPKYTQPLRDTPQTLVDHSSVGAAGSGRHFASRRAAQHARDHLVRR